MHQIRVPRGTNEIKIAPIVIKGMNVQGKIFTMDAMHAQKETAAVIIETNNNYVMALKGNQHQFFKDIVLFLNSMSAGEFDIPYAYHERTNRGHGRVEIRRCWTTNHLENWLEQLPLWAGLQSISIVETEISQRGKRSVNRRYFISSLHVSAERMLHIIRSHWSIETNFTGILMSLLMRINQASEISLVLKMQAFCEP